MRSSGHARRWVRKPALALKVSTSAKSTRAAKAARPQVLGCSSRTQRRASLAGVVRSGGGLFGATKHTREAHGHEGAGKHHQRAAQTVVDSDHTQGHPAQGLIARMMTREHRPIGKPPLVAGDVVQHEGIDRDVLERGRDVECEP